MEENKPGVMDLIISFLIVVCRLPRGSSLRLTSSTYPLPLINIGKYDADWYEGITQKLKWNQSITGVGDQGNGADPLNSKPNDQ